jgi:hypothetical protein
MCGKPGNIKSFLPVEAEICYESVNGQTKDKVIAI